VGDDHILLLHGFVIALVTTVWRKGKERREEVMKEGRKEGGLISK